MNFIQRLFNKTTATEHLVDCPRCLGKGYVDMDDIKRLKNQLKWLPGKCAYCNAVGKVEPDMINKVAADEAYLAVNLPKKERDRVINRDLSAIARSKAFNATMDDEIQNIKTLYFEQHLGVKEIAETYLETIPDWTIQQKNELIDYITKVIDHSKT